MPTVFPPPGIQSGILTDNSLFAPLIKVLMPLIKKLITPLKPLTSPSQMPEKSDFISSPIKRNAPTTAEPNILKKSPNAPSFSLIQFPNAAAPALILSKFLRTKITTAANAPITRAIWPIGEVSRVAIPLNPLNAAPKALIFPANPAMLLIVLKISIRFFAFPTRLVSPFMALNATKEAATPLTIGLIIDQLSITN